MGNVLLGLGADLFLLSHLSVVDEVLVVLNLLVGLLNEGLGLRLVLHLGVETKVLFSLHQLIALPGVQDLVLSFFGAEMGFNGHPVDHFGDSSSFIILLHLASDGVVEVLDLLLTILVFMVHNSLLVLDVKCVLTNVVLVLGLFKGNLAFVTLLGFLNGGQFNGVVILEHTEVLNGGYIARVVEGLDASNGLAGVFAEAVRRGKAAGHRKSNRLGRGPSSNGRGLRLSSEVGFKFVL